MYRPFISVFRAGTLLLAVLLIFFALPHAETLPFCDLDGDGFDDNNADGNGDGIPDFLAPDYIAPLEDAELSGVFGSVDLGGAPSETVVPDETNAEKFGGRQFPCRMLESNRSDFDAGFSAGIDAGGGHGCAGGICW